MDNGSALLERSLRDLGERMSWPDLPDLAPAVAAEVRGTAPVVPMPRRRGRRAVVLAAAAAMVVGGLLAVSPGLRAAVLRLFGLPGVRIEVQETPVSPSPSVSPPELSFGREVSLQEAAREAPFEILQPAALGDPDRVYLLGFGEDQVVTLAYGRRPGLPRETAGVSVLVSELRARPDEELIRKTAMEAQVTRVRVNGERGYWVEGPHTVLLLTDSDGVIEDRARLATSTLLWTRGDLTIRLEGDLSLAQALQLARSVR
jgi:hypothetical protein